jgi:hypothetical protein
MTTRQFLLGRRIELPVHYEMWMRGARFGKVTVWRRGKPGQSSYVLVKMDNPHVKYRVKLWEHDWNYVNFV